MATRRTLSTLTCLTLLSIVASMTDDIPGFYLWQGCGGIWYAKRLRASPPVILRAESVDELRQKVDSWRGDHPVDERYYFEPSPDTY